LVIQACRVAGILARSIQHRNGSGQAVDWVLL
jgi:hypothetical protein